MGFQVSLLLCLFAMVMPYVAYGATVDFSDKKGRVEMDQNGIWGEESMKKMIIEDARSLISYREGLKYTIKYLDDIPTIFPHERVKVGEILTGEQRQEVRRVWNNYLDYHLALGGLVQKYRDYDDIQGSNISKDYAFKVYRAAFNAQYLYAMKFIARAEKNKQLDKVMNEQLPELGLSADTYKDFKYDYLNVVTATKFAALEAINKLSTKENIEMLVPIATEDAAGIWDMGKGRGELLTIKNAGKILKKSGEKIIYPLQVGVSEWLGDTRVYRKDVSLISQDDINSIKPKLEPGDIMFERREWFMSNIGLPGYWPHAALYIGNYEQRKEFFNDPEVNNWVKSKGLTNNDFNGLLEKTFPAVYRNSFVSWHEKEPRVIEAIGEGVVFTSLEYSAAADSLAVLRPSLTKVEKAKAILKAFSFAGRPYDFNFDFQTDASIVCSELVFKAYDGLMKFKVSRMLGRYVLSPNDIVQQFVESKGTELQQLDFVLFLDGDEYNKKANYGTEDEFSLSWKRPKWHILLKK